MAAGARKSAAQANGADASARFGAAQRRVGRPVNPMASTYESISAGIRIAGSAMQFLEYLRNIAEANVISAYFKFDGTHIEGSTKIDIEITVDESRNDVFWLNVKQIKDYVFFKGSESLILDV
ncbi:MAG: hypothetical protein HYX63_08875 [Gammaproteobacteria bacterium]|nr:hypothetical protein [Gammaproteobacteria bacterium]